MTLLEYLSFIDCSNSACFLDEIVDLAAVATVYGVRITNPGLRGKRKSHRSLPCTQVKLHKLVSLFSISLILFQCFEIIVLLPLLLLWRLNLSSSKNRIPPIAISLAVSPRFPLHGFSILIILELESRFSKGFRQWLIHNGSPSLALFVESQRVGQSQNDRPSRHDTAVENVLCLGTRGAPHSFVMEGV